MNLEERVEALELEVRVIRNLEESRWLNLEQRVSVLQNDYVTLAQGPMIQRRMLQALRDTQSDHTRTLREHGEVLDELKLGQERLREDLERGMTSIVGMLTTLIDREESTE